MSSPYYNVYETSTKGHADLESIGIYASTIYSRISLREEGCWVDGVRNCTAMCTDSNLIWASSPDKANMNVSANVGNCAIYPVLANLLDYERSNFSSSDVDLLTQYGILSASDTDVTAISDTSELCLQNYCDANPSKCGSPTFLTFEYDRGNITLPNYGAICHSVQGSLNPDVAGIGVLTAYLMAAVILLIVYIGLRFFRTFARFVTWPYFLVSERGPQFDWHHANEKSATVQKSIASSHHVAILISSLADFQKGQCVFWLSIDAAVLIGVAGSAQTLGSSTLASFYLNLQALRAVCVCGYLFTTFGLYCLHQFSKRSWYIFSLSFVTAVFSAIAWGVTFFANPDNLAPNRDVRIDGCGPFDPTAYCGDGLNDYGTYSLQRFSSYQVDSAAIGFGGMCMLVMFGDMVVHKTKCQSTRLGRYLCICDRPISRWRFHTIATVEFLVEAVFLILWALLFAWLITLARASDVKTWGFGQIIALTIWIPVLLEWLYATTRGLENATEYHITTPYRLIRADKIKRISYEVPQYNKLGTQADEENNEGGTNLEDISYQPEHRIPRKPVPSRSVHSKKGSVTHQKDERLPLSEQDLLGSSSGFFHDR